MLVTSIPGASSPSAGDAAPETDLASLQAELSAMAEQVTQIVADRARRAEAVAQSGIKASRDTIVQYPVETMLAVFAAGALLGLAVTAKPARTRGFSAANVKADLDSYAHQLRRSVMHGVNETSMADRLERLTSALSATDAKAAIGPTVERVLGWFGQAKELAQSAVNKVS